MTFLFYWTGLVIWSTLILGFGLLALLIFWHLLLSIICTLSQELWVKRAGIPRNDVGFWYIVRQDLADPAMEKLSRTWSYLKKAYKRQQPVKTGFRNIPTKES